MKEQEYHIDVTPEEDNLFRDEVEETPIPKRKKPTFGKVFWAVSGAHVIAIGALMATGSAMSSKPAINLAEPIPEIPQHLSKELHDSDSASNDVEETLPIASPEEVVVQAQPEQIDHLDDAPKIKTPAPQLGKPNVGSTKKLAEAYVVKKGDTIYSISKKFKLSTQKLLEINNIKDPNKITIGQKLKFL
jgi:LysM repeat protein